MTKFRVCTTAAAQRSQINQCNAAGDTQDHTHKVIRPSDWMSCGCFNLLPWCLVLKWSEPLTKNMASCLYFYFIYYIFVLLCCVIERIVFNCKKRNITAAKIHLHKVLSLSKPCYTIVNTNMSQGCYWSLNVWATPPHRYRALNEKQSEETENNLRQAPAGCHKRVAASPVSPSCLQL